jgi:hypothetical protein
VSRTSSELRVEWNHPKRRMAATAATTVKPALPRFRVVLQDLPFLQRRCSTIDGKRPLLSCGGHP